jgi:hypothetical protein
MLVMKWYINSSLSYPRFRLERTWLTYENSQAREGDRIISRLYKITAAPGHSANKTRARLVPTEIIDGRRNWPSRSGSSAIIFGSKVRIRRLSKSSRRIFSYFLASIVSCGQIIGFETAVSEEDPVFEVHNSA